MNWLITRKLAMAFTLLCMIGSLKAQTNPNDTFRSNLPIIPMTVRFQSVPQYFVQLMSNDVRYGSIEALIDNDPRRPWYEVILTDKVTGNRILYCNWEDAVNHLREEGTIAHYAAIEFTAVETTDLPFTYVIRLQDSHEQEISWKFTVNPHVMDARTELMSHRNSPGFALIFASRRSAALKGTTVTIGNRINAAEMPDLATAVQNSVPNQAFYAMDVTIAEIAPTRQFWKIESNPVQLKEGENWILRSNSGQKRRLVVERDFGDYLWIRLDGQDDHFSAPARLDVMRQNNGFALRSVTFERQSHSFRLSFNPALPLLATRVEDMAEVGFVIAQDDQDDIAQGKLSILRAHETEDIFWDFDTPNWAKANAFETSVNVIP